MHDVETKFGTSHHAIGSRLRLPKQGSSIVHGADNLELCALILERHERAKGVASFSIQVMVMLMLVHAYVTTVCAMGSIQTEIVSHQGHHARQVACDGDHLL